MRRAILCLVPIALTTMLLWASSAVIVEVAYCAPDVILTPSTPTPSDNINVTVSYFFSSAPPYVDDFGPVVQVGNTFSANITVFFPAPSDVVLFIVHTDSHTYNLGNLSVGQYEFRVHINRTHFMEGYYLGEKLEFNVTVPADVDHDLDVDIYDAVKCGIAYGSTPSSPNWDPYCDIAEPYGIVNIFDLVTIAASYGEEYLPAGPGS